jgi:dihydroxyacetone kinase
VIAAEPDLTKWDTIMGDGDCGETFRTGCQEVLSLLSSGLASSGSLLTVLAAVAEITESKMGGTLGAILSIFFHAFQSELAKSGDITSAPARACKILEGHTAARVGHRTILDVIIPASEKFRETGRLEDALEAAVKGAEGTRLMKPLLGRATYVGGMEGKELPADPGAWGAMLLIKGLYDGLQL